MDFKKDLNKLLSEYNNLNSKYQGIMEKIGKVDYIKENEIFKEQLLKNEQQLKKLEKKLSNLKGENSNLKTTLKEQIIDEKLKILKLSQEKLDVYFKETKNDSENRLRVVENSFKNKINKLDNIIKNEIDVEYEQFKVKIDNLKNEINKSITIKRSRIQDEFLHESIKSNNEYKKLKDEGVSDEVIQKRVKDNNLEINIGLKIVSIIGIILILIGFSTGLRYMYSNFFTPEIKGITIYIIGIFFLLMGEVFYRKQKEIFSYAVTSGGIAIFYIATFNSYFNLEIFNLNISLIMSIFITLLAIFLALRFNSKVIISISLVGGYLPFFTYVFSIGLDGEKDLLIASGYLIMLNILVIVISTLKKWIVTNYVSFLLNLPSMLYIIFSFKNELNGIILGFIIFILYIIVVMIYPIIYKKILLFQDLILLFLNSVLTSMTIFLLVYNSDYEKYDGFLALIFCLIYLILYSITNKLIKEEKAAKILFLATGYTFAVLMIPFHFGIKWFSFGWMVESVLLVIFGYKKKIKFAEITGWIVFGLSYFSVIFVDFFIGEMVSSVPFLHLRYTLLNAAMILILIPYIVDLYKDKVSIYGIKGNLISVYKYFTILNFWIYSIVEVMYRFRNIDEGYKSLFIGIGCGIVTLTTAYLIVLIPQIKDKITKIISIVFMCISNVIFISYTYFYKLDVEFKKEYLVLAFIILIIVNIYTFVNLRLLTIKFLKSAKINIEYFTVVMCIYLLMITNRILSYQFNLVDYNLMFSILYIITALIIIIYGFKKKYIISRRFGLMLSIFSTGKLFIYDLSFLNMKGRIISYLTFGFILLGISYMYQKFSKEIKGVFTEYNIDELENR